MVSILKFPLKKVLSFLNNTIDIDNDINEDIDFDSDFSIRDLDYVMYHMRRRVVCLLNKNYINPTGSKSNHFFGKKKCTYCVFGIRF